MTVAYFYRLEVKLSGTFCEEIRENIYSNTEVILLSIWFIVSVQWIWTEFGFRFVICKFYSRNSLLTFLDAFYTGNRLIPANLYLDRLTGFYQDK